MSSSFVLFGVFAMMMANATVFATLGLFGRSVGLTEFQVGTIFASSAVLFFFTSTRWGDLADRWGRRPVIAVGLVGTAVSLFFFAAIVLAEVDPAGALAAFGMLLGTRFVYGLLAGGTRPAATAYMADVTTTSARSAGVARVGAAIGLGTVAGPLSVAMLIDLGVATPLLLGGVLALLAAVFVFTGVRETRPVPSLEAQPLGGAPGLLAPFLILAFVMHFAFAALHPTNAFYIQDHLRIGTASALKLAGLVSAGFAAGSFVVQAFVVPRLGLPPRRLLAFGLVLCLVALAVYLWAPTFGWLLVGFSLLGCGFGFAQPGLTAAASLAAGDRQAQVAGSLQAAMAAARIGGVLAGTAIYGLSIGGPLGLAMAAILASLVVVLFVGRERWAGEADSRPADRDRLL